MDTDMRARTHTHLPVTMRRLTPASQGVVAVGRRKADMEEEEEEAVCLMRWCILVVVVVAVCVCACVCACMSEEGGGRRRGIVV